MPTDEELKAVRDQLRFPSEAEIQAQRRALPRADAPHAAPSAPSPAIDIEALAKQVERTHPAAFQTGGGAVARPALYVFVSMSVPRETLAVLADQAARAKATLVLRGLVDRSFVKTSQAVRTAVGDIRSGWIVDPRLFERFEVSAAPTFVLANAAAARVDCSDRQCARAADFAKVAGDVSLDYALRHIATRHPVLADLATTYLTRLAPAGR